jgi:hypothetical protein
MRKITLFILVLGQISLAVAQSLTVTGGTSFTGDLVTQISNHLDIKNTSANTITVECQKTNLNVPLGGESFYCFAGNCYSAGATTASSSADLLPGQQISFDNSDADAHSGYYDAYGISGVAEVQYCFYDVNNPSDQTCVTITYECSSATAVNDFNELTEISDFYPNPANGLTHFTFNGTKAQLNIIDILGNEIKVLQLEQPGVKKIDLTDMSKGVYFGKLVINNKITTIKKLIVK